MKEQVEDVIAAIEKIQYMPRESGENAIPEIGVIIATVKAAGIARLNRETNGNRTVLVGRECPACWYRCGGFVEANDFKARYCHRCGAPMNEIHRESVA